MRFLWVASIAVLLASSVSNVSGVAQATSAAASVPALPKEPAEIFAAAAPLYDFSSPSLKPWHMKVSYQLYDEKGGPTDKGSYEYWWATPDTYRSTWLRPGVELTDWHVAGKAFHVGRGESLDFFERKLQSDLLTPLPDVKDLDAEKVRLERHDEKFGSTKLPCVMVIHKTPYHAGQLDTVPMGMFPTYCFEPEHPMLRAFYAFGATQVIYNKVIQVQGMFLARELTILEGQRTVLTATVDLIQGLNAKAAALVPAKEAVALDGLPKIELGSGVAAGNLLKKVPPHYPDDAKQAHVEGTVKLRALIGMDGHIHDLSVEEGPSPSLIGSAMWAVSQWVYKPYLLNGTPVEVETEIKVIYRLGS